MIRLIEYTLYLTRFAHAGPFPNPETLPGGNEHEDLGIIVCTVRRSPPFLEAGFQRLAWKAGGWHRTADFFPKQVDWNRRRVKGWTYSGRKPVGGR